jgi:rSAM/selenodomain-associated transferase 1
MRIVLIFAKYPIPGKVKTRLAEAVGDAIAAEIYKQMVEYICSILPTDVTPWIMFDPPESRSEFERWLRPRLSPDVRYIPQCEGDLGMRLSEGFDAALKVGEAVAAIGTDCIEIEASIFSETWSALERSDCVLGPADDGGYYLIAMKRRIPELFCDISWSSKYTLSETLDRASGGGLGVYLLPAFHDVDTESDWKRAKARLGSAFQSVQKS